MPDVTFNTIDEVPEELREGAKAGDDGKVTLNLVTKSKLDEFRNNNVAVSKERDEALTMAERFKKVIGDDPDAFQTELEELRQTKQLVDDGKLKKNEDIESTIASRTENMKQSYEVKLSEREGVIEALNGKLAQAEEKFKGTIVDRAIRDAALSEDLGVNPVAIDDIAMRGMQVFGVYEGDEILSKKGDTTVYGEDGVSPLKPGEWIKSLSKTHPHYFLKSTGGGAEGDTQSKFGGLSESEFNGLSAKKKLELARSKNLS